MFDALGADTYVINAQPNGTNINNNTGSTHIEDLQKFVVEKGLDVGFAMTAMLNVACVWMRKVTSSLVTISCTSTAAT